jgi:hypothetical protein
VTRVGAVEVAADVISSRKIAIEVDVRGPGDVDDELREWLREAYELHAGASRTSD